MGGLISIFGAAGVKIRTEADDTALTAPSPAETVMRPDSMTFCAHPVYKEITL